MPTSPNRRSFIGAVASLSGIAIFAPGSVSRAMSGAEPTSSTGGQGTWDLSWIDQLRGKHKQVFAAGSVVGHDPLHVVVNYLDAHLEVFGLKHPDVNAVVGITGGAFPINVGDAIWAKYDLGRRWEVKDTATGDWATRNVYLSELPAPRGKVVSVPALQARGAVFYQCNNALNGVVRKLARDTGRPVEGVREDLIAGLNPGVRLVPAHTMTLGLLQERGCTYEQIG